MTMGGDEVKEIKSFKYLKSFVQKNYDFDENIKQD